MSEPTTHAIDVPGAVLTYDVREPATPSEHRPVFVFGSPMAASGFSQLVSHLDDRTVITYDPRVSERSKLEEGAEVSYEVHGDDVHRVVEATGLGPVDVFASSGGAVAALPWVLAHPDEVGTVVAHEPPLSALLEDREMLDRVLADIAATYREKGQGPAMAKFIQLVMHDGPVPDDYLDPAGAGPRPVRVLLRGRRQPRRRPPGTQPDDAGVPPRRGGPAGIGGADRSGRRRDEPRDDAPPGRRGTRWAARRGGR